MSLSRRRFVKTLGMGGAGAAILVQRGPEALADLFAPRLWAAERPILLHNNENPLGPGKSALEAMRSVLGSTGARAGRYPFDITSELYAAIAKHHGVTPEHILVGNGSTQVLRTATFVYTSDTRPLVAGSPTYEEAPNYARLLGRRLVEVPLDANLKLDLAAMADASRGAGLVFVNNPNNPTATLHSADAIAGFIDRVLTASPDTTILIDEAYHDYVTDRSHKTQIPLAVKNPRVLVARTFSKAHGMAGLRVGYVVGHPETIKQLRAVHYGTSINVLGIVAATASIQDQKRIEQEVARNTAVRQFTVDWFKRHGFRATDSQCNFIFVEIKRPAREFREACRQQGVIVGRDFPPFERSWARISIGTMEEMKVATRVFGQVLGVQATAAAA